MARAELKTQTNDLRVERFLDSVADPRRREDCYALVRLMKRITKKPPRMWGASIVGFGSYHYKYESGREGDWFLSGFSPRKQNLTIYIMGGLERNEDLAAELGKYKAGGSCLYVKSLADINSSVLTELIERSVEYLRKKYRKGAP